MQVNVQRSLQIQLRVYCFYLFDQMRILLIQICNSAVAHKHMYAHEDWCEIIYSARTIHEIWNLLRNLIILWTRARSN